MTNIKSLLKISLPILIPLFFIIFLAGGCSFKLIDPQYYEFRKLCSRVDIEIVIHNKYFFEIQKNKKFIETDDNGCFYDEILKEKICFGYFQRKSNEVHNKWGLTKTIAEDYYKNTHYSTSTYYKYSYSGLFLKGDEGAGFWIDTKDLRTCEYWDNFFYEQHSVKQRGF